MINQFKPITKPIGCIKPFGRPLRDNGGLLIFDLLILPCLVFIVKFQISLLIIQPRFRYPCYQHIGFCSTLTRGVKMKACSSNPDAFILRCKTQRQPAAIPTRWCWTAALQFLRACTTMEPSNLEAQHVSRSTVGALLPTPVIIMDSPTARSWFPFFF